MRYVANEFRKRDNLSLVTAMGDLYIEIARPHQILGAARLILEKDPEACVGSRMLLSVVEEPVPSCADFMQLAWLYDIGYRRFLLCDELCLKEDLLATAVNAFESFRSDYARRSVLVQEPSAHKSIFGSLLDEANRAKAWWSRW